MPCFKPREGWRSTSGGWTSNPKQAYVDQPLSVPCGQCIGCRAAHAESWAARCAHELQYHARSCFVTLTYSDEHLPEGGTLVKRHAQLFLKRLRKRFEPHRLSYFGCGEYGSELARPHYHFILFGVDFDDKRHFKKGTGGKGSISTSATLDELWPYGFCTVGNANYQTACYTAKYVTKKITGEAAEKHYGGRLPEFLLVSTKPAIGARWFAANHTDTFPTDSVISNGREISVPRYYDKLLRRKEAELLKSVKHERRIAAHDPKVIWNNTPDRLAVREYVAKSKANIFKQREFEK